MQWVRLVVLALLAAGCAQPSAPTDDEPILGGEAPQSFDHLTDRLHPDSGPVQDFLVVEDNLSLPGGAFVWLVTGRGMHCQGDVDDVAPNATGWVTCIVRLVSEPSSMAQDVRELGIGLDSQRLSLRMAAEPVEWRLVVTVNTRMVPVFDSGWRLVDLSPTVEEPELAVSIINPCDAPDAVEQDDVRGSAKAYVNFTASHGQPFVSFDFGRSRPGDARSLPFAGHTTSEHGIVASYPTFGPTTPATFEVFVNLEAAEDAGEATPGPCQLSFAQELQTWTVLVGITGADGLQQYLTRTLDVTVYLTVVPSTS